MMEDEHQQHLKDLLASAMPHQQQSLKQQSLSPQLYKNNALLKSLTGSEPSLTILRKPSSSPSVSSVKEQLVGKHLAISNFKPVPQPADFCPRLVSASQHYIAYVVGQKKVRLLEQEKGQKGMMQSQVGNIMAIGLLEETLASLNEAGELLIGTVYAESAESLGFQPLVQLTFPDLVPARGLAWANTASINRRVLAAWGSGPAAFLVWLEPSPMAAEIPHSLTSTIQSIAFYRNGQCVAITDGMGVECFQLDHEGKALEKMASFTLGAGMARVELFEGHSDGELAIAALSNAGAFSVCLVHPRVRETLAWSPSSAHVSPSDLHTSAITFDPLLEIFLLDQRNGRFTVVALRDTAPPSLGCFEGKWAEELPVLSMALCPALRNPKAGIHSPLYVFQSEWVSFYGLKLPSADPSGEREFLPPVPKVVPLPAAIKSNKTINTVVSAPLPPVTSPLAPPSAPVVSDAAIKEAVKAVMMETIVPSLEASFAELFDQVKRHLATQTANGTNHIAPLEAKIDALAEAVVQLQESILSSAASPHEASEQAEPLEESSLDDLVKRELEEMLQAEGPVPALAKALSLGNLDTLTWLLARLEPSSTIDAASPGVLLSLAQQLGADLATETELKLDWLAELFTLFKAQEGDEQTVSEVLDGLFAALPAGSPLHKKIKLVMRLVRLVM